MCIISEILVSLTSSCVSLIVLVVHVGVLSPCELALLLLEIQRNLVVNERSVNNIMCSRISYVFAWFCLTFFVVLPLLCHRLKYSAYYGLVWRRNKTKENIDMMKDNYRRLILANEEISGTRDLTSKAISFLRPNNLTDIVITLITVSRGSRQYSPLYLTQTVGKLLHLLKKNSANMDFTYSLMVCNVDPFPQMFAEAVELSSHIHTVSEYKENTQLYNLNSQNRFEKEKHDYLYCLKESLLYQPKYVLLMEDDAYPNDEMFPVLEYSIHNIFEEKFSESDMHQRRNIAYLKLYHPPRLLGFIDTEVSRLFELAAAVTFIMAMIGIYKEVFSLRTIGKFQIMSFSLYITLLALALGRPNLLFIRTLLPCFHSFVTAPSCCTPANLYSYDGALAVINSLEHKISHSGYAKDTLLDEFLKESRYSAVYVEPNIFTHIGQYSSLRKGLVLDPYVV